MIEKILQTNLCLKLTDRKKVLEISYTKSNLDLKKGDEFNLEEDMWDHSSTESQVPVRKGKYKITNVSRVLAQTGRGRNIEDYFTVTYDCERIGDVD